MANELKKMTPGRKAYIAKVAKDHGVSLAIATQHVLASGADRGLSIVKYGKSPKAKKARKRSTTKTGPGVKKATAKRSVAKKTTAKKTSPKRATKAKGAAGHAPKKVKASTPATPPKSVRQPKANKTAATASVRPTTKAA